MTFQYVTVGNTTHRLHAGLKNNNANNSTDNDDDDDEKYIEWFTLQDKIFPKTEKVSYNALLSTLLSRFLINMLLPPDFLFTGSFSNHLILIFCPFIMSKFIVSMALLAAKYII